MFAVDAMEVHVINCYGEDPFISTGTYIYLKYPERKSVSRKELNVK
jgi:hypothetical protein